MNPNFGGVTYYPQPNQMPSGMAGWSNRQSNNPQSITPAMPQPTTFNSNSPLSGILDKLGGMLRPMGPYQNYETFAQPQREAFNLWEKNTYRPEFERFTLNPFNQQYSNQAAASNMNMMGNAQGVYNTKLRQVEQPYYNQLESAKNAYENMVRGMYNTRLQRDLDSPTAFNNLGTSQGTSNNMGGMSPLPGNPSNGTAPTTPGMPSWGTQNSSASPWGGTKSQNTLPVVMPNNGGMNAYRDLWKGKTNG